MADNEMLSLILESVNSLKSEMKTTNDRLDKIEHRLDIVEFKQDHAIKKLEDLQLDVKIAERDIRRDIHSLKEEAETIVEVLRMNEMIPR